MQEVRIGEGLVGQCAAEKRRMLITELPKKTAPIRSGLFKAHAEKRDCAAGAV